MFGLHIETAFFGGRARVPQKDTFQQNVLIRQCEWIIVVLGDSLGKVGNVYSSVAFACEVEVLVFQTDEFRKEGDQSIKVVVCRLYICNIRITDRKSHCPRRLYEHHIRPLVPRKVIRLPLLCIPREDERAFGIEHTIESRAARP